MANLLSAELYKLGKPHAVLDGDNLRLGINKDLGFSPEERTENIRRTAEISRLMVNSGLLVLVALVSPSELDRKMAKEIIGEDFFSLIYVDTPLEVCESRDPTGLYGLARQGKLPNFTGVSSEYEPPEEPDFIVRQHQSLSDLNWQSWLS